MELLYALGLDVRILLSQFINFAVLVFVLYRFAYKPIFNILEERKRKIQEGVEKFEYAEKTLEEAHQKSVEILKEAKKEAKEIVEKASRTAQSQREELLSVAKGEIGEMMQKAQKDISHEKKHLLEGIRKDIVILILLSVEKILQKDITESDRKVFAERAIQDFNEYSKRI